MLPRRAADRHHSIVAQIKTDDSEAKPEFTVVPRFLFDRLPQPPESANRVAEGEGLEIAGLAKLEHSRNDLDQWTRTGSHVPLPLRLWRKATSESLTRIPARLLRKARRMVTS